MQAALTILIVLGVVAATAFGNDAMVAIASGVLAQLVIEALKTLREPRS